ncbi:MAG: hypothetical protein NVSMB7_00620 [Chitinophagaceae bacterium]
MSSILNIPAAYYAENNIRYVFLDGRACNRLDTCFNTLQEQLSIPAYFGKNLDALEEVLEDMDWIAEEKVKIIILNSPALLENELAKKNIFLDILQSTGNKKIEIIYVGKTASE